MAATPALAALEAAHVEFTVHKYPHDRRSTDYGAEAVAAMTAYPGITADRIFKTLVVELGDRKLGVAVVPVPSQLSLKAAAKAFGAAKAVMAQAAVVTRSTGYVLGGVSPIGQRTALPTVIDDSALSFPTILVSGGKRGLEIELAAVDLIAATDATTAGIATG